MNKKEEYSFNLNREYNKEFPTSIQKQISIGNKRINDFEWSGEFEKPFLLFFGDCEVKNFCLDNFRKEFLLKEIIFLNATFFKSEKLGYEGGWDFVYNKGENVVENFEIGYTNCNIESKAKLFFGNFRIKEFHIYNTEFKNNYTLHHQKKSVKFDSIKIYEPLELGRLRIDNVVIKKLHLESMNMVGCETELRNMKIGELIINNTNLGNTVFNGVQIGKLTLVNVTLNDCIFNGVEFETYELGKEIDGNTISDKKIKDNYRQLKHVMDKNGNHTEANKFFAKEMEEYEKSLGIVREGFWGTILDILNTVGFGGENKKRGEKLILIFSDSITEHGTNLIRGIFALFLLALFATIFTCCYLIFGIQIYNLIIGIESIAYDLELSFNIAGCLATLFIIFVILLAKKHDSNTVKKREKQEIIADTTINKEASFLNFDILFTFFLIITIVVASLVGGIVYGNTISGEYVFIPFKHFISLMNPTYGFFRHHISDYSTIELTYFLIYKVLYGIIFWHLIVAAKRTTRR